MNRINYFDPRTGALLSRPAAQGLLLGPAPMRTRRRGFGDIPNSRGGPGPLTDPYTEQDGIFNDGGGVSGAAAVSQSTAATPNPSATGYLPGSAPYGESDRPWTNPTTFATVPINAQTNTQVPTLSQNFQRNALIIQNNSFATNATDVPPTLYVGFNAQPIVGFSLSVAPLAGIAFDIITPRDSIYVAFGPFVNTGGTVVIRGAVIQGTYAP